MPRPRFIIDSLKSLKVVGRKRVQFHLDQLVIIQQQPVDGNFFWLCRMGDPKSREYPGDACSGHGVNLETQLDAEESALTHLSAYHAATGGERRDPNRGRLRREQELADWNRRHARRTAEWDE